MLNFLNNTALPKRFVSIDNRTTASDLPESFLHAIAENSCDINWKNIPLQKSPFQIINTQGLIQELNPKP
ncbi:hypothetical protein [Candidatus Rickettsia kedanie]|uniref:Uncharacterized protein n=1 Tax=Candidatus Rickettsia kedanie TaxID=3115352 RepID=A0ABP9TWD8_9RICK